MCTEAYVAAAVSLKDLYAQKSKFDCPVIRQTLNAQQSSIPISQSDSSVSTQSLAHGGVPELFLGLSYSATTGRLAVEIIKGSHFRNLAATRPPGQRQRPQHAPAAHTPLSQHDV